MGKVLVDLTRLDVTPTMAKAYMWLDGKKVAANADAQGVSLSSGSYRWEYHGHRLFFVSCLWFRELLYSLRRRSDIKGQYLFVWLH